MIKQKAIECIAALPDNADWDDVLYALYVRQKIERSLKDETEGLGLTIEEARTKMGIL